jgi:CMP-N-acetylneuraminic acid synthetase
LDVAESVGFKRIKRPDYLAAPESLHVDAIKHALELMKEDGVIPDILVVLLGNTVYVKRSWIEESIDLILNDPLVSTVAPAFIEQDHHPYRAKCLDENGFLRAYFDFKKDDISSNRQDLPKNLFFCHNFWTLNMKRALGATQGEAPWEFMGDNVKPVVVDEGFDVHEEEDLMTCEKWVKLNNFFD